MYINNISTTQHHSHHERHGLHIYQNQYGILPKQTKCFPTNTNSKGGTLLHMKIRRMPGLSVSRETQCLGKGPMTLKLDMQHWVHKYYLVYSKYVPGLTLTYFTARSNLVPYAFVWKKDKTIDFSKTIVVCDVKVGIVN